MLSSTPGERREVRTEGLQARVIKEELTSEERGKAKGGQKRDREGRWDKKRKKGREREGRKEKRGWR